jgi:hypothetical protein
MRDLIVIAIVLAIVVLAAWYVIKSKKSGKKCIGCPAGCCASKNGCGCGCGDNDTNNK